MHGEIELSKDVPRTNGVWMLSDPSAFEALYEAVRTKERRILTDAEVARLPDGSGLWNALEWRIRARSAARLVHQLNGHGERLRVLEVGCGNGWLSRYMHRAGHAVLGIDVFTRELEQAARVHREVRFARAELLDQKLPAAAFDAVVFAASIQYFPDPLAAMHAAFRSLAPGGLVHVLDTVLYADAASAEQAQQRTRNYFHDLGHPAMSERYHAHPISLFLDLGGTRVVARPRWTDRMSGLLGRPVPPFTHLELRPALKCRSALQDRSV
ncbi:MAG: methyltransferase domain-containing protein [Flavobacteriales bacterium]|nr:methyltransferase domain-containing protein [Flavobacteriales bacterium]